jgi:hypothetical protein
MNSETNNPEHKHTSLVTSNHIQQVLKNLEKSKKAYYTKDKIENIQRKYDSRVSNVMRSLSVALMICMVLTSLSIYSLPTAAKKNNSINDGSIKVYWEDECFNEITSIDWGIVEPGSPKAVVIYIKNTGRKNLNLELCSNVDPIDFASNLDLQWNYSGEQIASGSTLTVTLTLMVSGDLNGVTTFNLEILVTGKEVIDNKGNGKGKNR